MPLSFSVQYRDGVASQCTPWYKEWEPTTSMLQATGHFRNLQTVITLVLCFTLSNSSEFSSGDPKHPVTGSLIPKNPSKTAAAPKILSGDGIFPRKESTTPAIGT